MTRTALITDINHFIGLPSARALIAEGYRVFGTDPAFADEAARRKATEEVPGIVLLTGTDPEDWLAQILADTGQLDVVISNDAFPAERFAIDDVPEENMQAAFEALVYRPMRLSRAVVPHFKERGEGKIILVTSAAPLNGLPNYSIYASARGATNAMALALAKELARSNIQVNAVAPNFVDNPDYFPKSLMDDPEKSAKILKQIPLGRLGKPEEAASLIVYLASPLSHFVTGQIIPLAGGWANVR